MVIAALAGVGWYYSNSILGPDAPRVLRGQAILGRTDSTITLATNPRRSGRGRGARVGGRLQAPWA